MSLYVSAKAASFRERPNSITSETQLRNHGSESAVSKCESKAIFPSTSLMSCSPLVENSPESIRMVDAVDSLLRQAAEAMSTDPSELLSSF